jgi:formyl-CoA transferase
MSLSERALSDIRILDLSRVLAGPFCTMVLSDYDAEVIKIEQPGVGDGTRQWGPPWIAGESAYFLSVNRNKKSMTLNLKTKKGRAILKQLLVEADILIENFKPGAMQRMGLDYESLSQDNPGLIYCSISGYGQTGPYRERPGYDFMIQAQGGIMSVTGPVEGEPHRVGVAIVDITAGLFASSAILSALHHRERTGEGQYIDVALLDAQVAWLANVAHNYFATRQQPGRFGNAHPNRALRDFPHSQWVYCPGSRQR